MAVARESVRESTKSPPSDELMWEIRLCFAVAFVCGLAGSLGWLIERFVAGSNSLEALIVVAALYVVMGATRSLKLLFGRKSSEGRGSGH